jgi:hypothetical protein
MANSSTIALVTVTSLASGMLAFVGATASTNVRTARLEATVAVMQSRLDAEAAAKREVEMQAMHWAMHPEDRPIPPSRGILISD